MGRPKALLPCRGRSFLRTILDALEGAGVERVRVVLGADAEAILSSEPLPESAVVRNPRPADGMLSSVRCGVRALGSGLDAFFLWPVDHPLVDPGSVAVLLTALAASGRGIAVPLYRGRRGHPVLFAARMAEALLAAPDAVGARAVLLERPEEVEEVATADPGVVADVDTPEAYRLHLGEPPC
jgi:nicotine blue oxidoreductase